MAELREVVQQVRTAAKDNPRHSGVVVRGILETDHKDFPYVVVAVSREDSNGPEEDDMIVVLPWKTLARGLGMGHWASTEVRDLSDEDLAG